MVVLNRFLYHYGTRLISRTVFLYLFITVIVSYLSVNSTTEIHVRACGTEVSVDEIDKVKNVVRVGRCAL